MAIVGLAIGLGPGGPNPGTSAAADRLVQERAEAASRAVSLLQESVAAALDAARRGAAAIVAGDAGPGEELERAAGLLIEAGNAADDVIAADTALDSARRARDPGADSLPLAIESGQLGSIGAQLRATVEAADLFADMRRRAANVPAALIEALDALTGGDLDGAAEHLAVAAADQAAVAAWDVDYPALPIWVDATDATIDAVTRLLEAVRRGDSAAAEWATADLSAISDEATRADRALQLTISEGGSAVAAGPLARLVEAKQAIDRLKAQVDAVLANGAG